MERERGGAGLRSERVGCVSRGGRKREGTGRPILRKQGSHLGVVGRCSECQQPYLWRKTTHRRTKQEPRENQLSCSYFLIILYTTLENLDFSVSFSVLRGSYTYIFI